MFTNRRKNEFLKQEFYLFWGGLAFQAGFVNAAGFLACARFVSHMTGFGTQVGISLSDSDYVMAVEMLSAPAAFLTGAMVSAFAIDRPIVEGRQPHYLLVMFGIFLVFTGVMMAGVWGWFGIFGEQLLYSRDFLLMGILCFVCGLQNACFTSLTRGQIRTTHLTGILTDIGIAFVKLFYMPDHTRDFTLLKRLNFVRMMTFCCFSFGSAVSAILVSHLGYLAFAMVVGTSSILFMAMTYQAQQRAWQRKLEGARRARMESKQRRAG
ncbi:DUF1275 domain-containing protein [bacterium]|nr:DUF1275 domain-containing protein [bacterium]